MFTIHTGNKGLLQTEVRVGNGLVPIQLDDNMGTTEWQVYQGDDPASKRFEIGVETNIRGEMRKAIQGLLDAEEPKQIVTTTPTKEPALPNPVPETSPPPKAERRLALVPTAEIRPAETMTDEETGEIVTITPLMRAEAVEVHRVVVFHDKQSYEHLQGMGEVIEAMAKRGWDFDFSRRDDDWTAEFSDLAGGRGVLAAGGTTAFRTVALAALAEVKGEK